MSDEQHIPDISDETAIKFAKIDLRIEDVLRSLIEDLEELGLDRLDQTIMTHYMRIAWLQGYEDACDGLTLDD